MGKVSKTQEHIYLSKIRTCSTSRCGNICTMQPKCSCKERRRGFSKRSSVEAAVSGRRCVFLGESKSTLFGLPKVDAFMNH